MPEPFLASGFGARSLFFSYLHRHRADESFAELAATYLDLAIDALAEKVQPIGLFAGSTGIAWLVEHLHGPSIDDADEDPNASLDEMLLRALTQLPPTADYDLIRGLTGIGVYALERVHRPAGRACLARVVTRLADAAEPRGPGLAWLSRPEHFWPIEREQYPRGNYNLGVAHGAPAAAVVLAGACAAGVEVARARPLLDGVMRWLLSSRLPPSALSAFPSRQFGEHGAEPSRAAWCYGDPGVCAALLAVARALGEAEWEREVLAVARRAAQRPLGNDGVVDAGICHGAGGLALLFHRLWNATGDELFADAARRWYACALEMHRPGTGVAGYRAWMPPLPPHHAGRWEDDGSLLTGTFGIGLVLLAGLGVEPAWDRMLAASLRSTVIA